MSQHNQEQKEGNFIATKLLCNDIPFEYSSFKALKKCRDIRHSCRENYKTNSTELCHDILKVCRDIIQEKCTELCHDMTLQATTKLEDKDGNYVVTKQPTGPILGDP